MTRLHRLPYSKSTYRSGISSGDSSAAGTSSPPASSQPVVEGVETPGLDPNLQLIIPEIGQKDISETIQQLEQNPVSADADEVIQANMRTVLGRLRLWVQDQERIVAAQEQTMAQQAQERAAFELRAKTLLQEARSAAGDEKAELKRTIETIREEQAAQALAARATEERSQALLNQYKQQLELLTSAFGNITESQERALNRRQGARSANPPNRVVGRTTAPEYTLPSLPAPPPTLSTPPSTQPPPTLSTPPSTQPPPQGGRRPLRQGSAEGRISPRVRNALAQSLEEASQPDV